MPTVGLRGGGLFSVSTAFEALSVCSLCAPMCPAEARLEPVSAS
jgi:hypothetical protein